MNAVITVLPRTHALILAGGRGERLHPLTLVRPKPLISFGGIFRIIDFTLSNCLNSSVNQVSILIQYRYKELHSFIRQNWAELWATFPQFDGEDILCLPSRMG